MREEIFKGAAGLHNHSCWFVACECQRGAGTGDLANKVSGWFIGFHVLQRVFRCLKMLLHTSGLSCNKGESRSANMKARVGINNLLWKRIEPIQHGE